MTGRQAAFLLARGLGILFAVSALRGAIVMVVAFCDPGFPRDVMVATLSPAVGDFLAEGAVAAACWFGAKRFSEALPDAGANEGPVDTWTAIRLIVFGIGLRELVACSYGVVEWIASFFHVGKPSLTLTNGVASVCLFIVSLAMTWWALRSLRSRI